jgi:light-regulated signal transduction histidine kinase (bacteriophytochrome)
MKEEMAGRARAEKDVNQLNMELNRQVAELNAVNEELEAFSYSVSHDLRAPLRHINGFVDLLRKTSAQLDSKAQRHLQIIGDSARQMGRLIDDLLVFSRMSRARMKVGKVNPDELVRQAQNELQGEIKGRNIVWNHQPLPVVEADAALLYQVFVNLLANAVKYSRPRNPAEIEIGYRNGSAEEIVIFVRDNGVGFDMQYAGKLFGVFQRLHRADEFEGTGIGLANVRRIINRHGGKTWAESTLDKGATFYFSLPIRSPHAESAARETTLGLTQRPPAPAGAASTKENHVTDQAHSAC